MKKLILFFISIGFILGLSINVNAATEITVDTNTCLEDDPGSCLITNESVITSTMGGDRDIGFYKTVDSFYNKTTNVITYEFTDTFKAFLVSTTDTEYDYSELTVDQYMKITGATEEEVQSGSTQLKNDLDNLYSLFAVYVRKNSIQASSYDSTNYVGTYLILPDVANRYLYAVMVANLQFEVDEAGEWILNPIRFVPKRSQVFSVTNFSIEVGGVSKGDYSSTAAADIGEDVRWVFSFNVPKYPTNAVNKVLTAVMVIPQGVDLTNDLSAVSFKAVGQNFENDGNGNIIDTDTGEIVVTLTYVDRILTINFDTDKIFVNSLDMYLDCSLNSKAVIGSNGNVFGFSVKYVKDPYGSDIITEDAGDMYKIYTYGLTLSLTDSDDATVFLPGAEFKLYDAADTEFKNALGTITIGEDGTASFVGIADGSYILKQTKAPIGYHMNEDYTFSFTSTDIDEEGYYSLSLTNQKYSLLPFTGGAGTLTYTLWGLLLIGLSALGVVLYKKKHQVDL